MRSLRRDVVQRGGTSYQNACGFVLALSRVGPHGRRAALSGGSGARGM